MQTPHFLVIGTQKGGTSSLYNALTQHPQIHKAARKEVHFFDQHYAHGHDWYLRQFPVCGPGEVTGEASPFYMAHPLAAQRIHQHCPAVKLILLLRNPADRAISHYHQEFRRDHDRLSLQEALAAEEQRTAADWDALAAGQLLSFSAAQRFSYRSRGYYAAQLERFFACFPREQFFIDSSERFFAEPQSLLSELYHFLGVDSGFHPADLWPRKPGNYGEADSKVRASLLEHFASHNDRLFSLLNRRFEWQ